MKKQFLKHGLMAVVLVVFIGFGIRSITQSNNRIQLKDIQLQDKSIELKELEVHYDTLNFELDKMLQEKDVDKQKFDQVQKERDELHQKLQQTEKELQAKAEAKRIASESLNKAAQQVSSALGAPQHVSAATSGSCDSWIAQAGIKEVSAAKELIRRESGCNPYSRNSSSGACGVAQELPCGKSGCQLGDGACQVKWMNSYVMGRYKSWTAAVSWHDSHHWY